MADLTGPRSVVVVLSYQGRHDTLDCVASLVDGSPEHGVLVVDNGSDDGVLEAVAERWPAVDTLQNGTNLGFAGGMNRGVARALEHGADVVTVLNNDTVVDPGAMDVLAGRARAGAVAVSPLVHYEDAERVWFGGGDVDPFDGLPRHLDDDGVARLRGPDPTLPYATDLLAGCCITASAATWRAVGGFDERFFLNFEDSEWSLRARRAGVRLEVAPAAVVRHAVSASFVGAYSYLGTFYYARNALLFSRLTGNGLVRTARLVRHRVVPGVGQAWRAGRAEGLRRALLLAMAVSAHAVRRYGRAPRWVERAAARWTTAPPARPAEVTG
ncbi:glycosyltransferase family 2 protein [Xylanimonas protaetiae]|uniref:Glycosyltransferase family 2 protein n=1 Tax=Xylanimonas protaetiae TaxID=2509457 RepID=A0A4P6F703_9MICO|nr:glycosyltransferase family 2 protein [Xylanimonas protaetiae]QAY69007.1 glycosyltransferase family 2 protein [Xylanimonas protaetiae]